VLVLLKDCASIPAGNVGIGTSSPSVPLHVLTNTVGVAEILRLKNSDTSNGQGAAIELQGFYPHARISTQGNPAANPGGDLRLQTYNPSNGAIGTGLILTGAGNVGIGVTAPGQLLQVGSSNGELRVGGSAGLDITHSNAGTTTAEIKQLYATTSDAAQLKIISGFTSFHTGTSNTERARIDSSGRLLVGTSTARSNFYGTAAASAALQIEGQGGTGDSRRLAIISSDNFSTAGGNLVLAFQRSGAVGGNTIVQSGDVVGVVTYLGNDGTNFVTAASIQAEVDGTPGANDMPGRIVFSSTTDGASSPTEAMRINSQQELLVGTATRNANGGVLQLKSGITFPATAVAATDANTLDDYEEGTFTPVINSGVVASGTFTSDSKYVKIGKTVTILIQQTGGTLTWTAGDLLFTSGGAPFAPVTTTPAVFTDTTPYAGGTGYVDTIGRINAGSAGTAITALRISSTYFIG
jgi:hypothetical protein